MSLFWNVAPTNLLLVGVPVDVLDTLTPNDLLSEKQVPTERKLVEAPYTIMHGDEVE